MGNEREPGQSDCFLIIHQPFAINHQPFDSAVFL